MNKYELALVVSAKIEDDARTATVEKAKEYITRAGGNVTEVEEAGKKKLAYEIQKMSEAFYYNGLFDRREESYMNKVILMGRLTRDAEIRYSQGESATAIARFSLAVDRRFRRDGDDQNTDFINCVAFGRTAEFLERFGRKGTKFVLEGRIQTGSYTNKDGQRVYTTDVVAENVEFAESKNASGGGDNSGFNPSDRPSPSSAAGDGFMNIPDGIDEELPFN